MEKRIEWIDIAKGIGIILVVIGHISQNKIISNFIYSFHMPLFFILSGFLYKPKEKYVRKKAKTILIPYIVFAIISYIYWFFIERNMREQDVNPINAFLNIFICQAGDENYVFNVVLWFLPCLFIVEIVFNLLYNKVNKNKYMMPIIIFLMTIIGYLYSKLSLIRLPFTIDISLTAIGFYYIGFCFNKYKDKVLISKLISNKKIKIAILIISFIIVAVISQFVGGIDMNKIKYNSYISTYIIAIIGSILIILLSQIINKNKVLQWLGKNSLIIMCIHEPIKRGIIGIGEIFLKISSDIIRNSILGIIVSTIIIFIIMIPCIFIINKYFPFFIGKNKKELKTNEKI